MIIESIKSEYQRYKSLAEMAIAQVKDDDLHKILGEDGNSIAVIMNHISGNLKSRFTNFLTEDGEKPWRNRDEEFEEKLEDRMILLKKWDESWRILFDEISACLISCGPNCADGSDSRRQRLEIAQHPAWQIARV